MQLQVASKIEKWLCTFTSLHYSILDIVSTIKAGIIYSIIVIIYFGGTYYG